MKKTLAIVLALAMVLCMIPVSFAAGTTTIQGEKYNLAVWSWQNGLQGPLGNENSASSVTAKYNYEDEKADITGQFSEDKKMAVLEIKGWDDRFNSVSESDIEVTVDGKKLEVNRYSEYGAIDLIGWNDTYNSVYMPLELTKAGYTDTYYVEVKAKIGDDTIIETAKISVRLENTAAYKNSKTAYITNIESQDRVLDAYIVGDKMYFDFVGNATNYDPVGWENREYSETVKITFADNNHDAFDVVTWAYEALDVDNGNKYLAPVKAEKVDGRWGKKLDDSALEYNLYDLTDEPTVTFELETASAIYETKEYEIVYRDNVVEADPKGIYFADTAKTIKIGESYSPVVMGVATNRKVDADLVIGQGTDKQVIDIDDDTTVIGTQEGVAYITAKYITNDGKEYTSSSMKITVTAQGATDDDDNKDGKTYMVTASSLRVRSGAGTNFSQIGSLKNGATVKVESIANGWAKLENGGYVSAQYLAEVVDNGEAQTMYVTARTLNVRKGPGTSYAKVGTLSRGTAVQVVGFSGNWAKLSNGYYVSTSYLSK